MDSTSVALLGKPSTRRRSFTVEFKRGLVAQCLEPGASVAKIAREHDLNTNQVFKWCRRYGPAAAQPSTPMLPGTVMSRRRKRHRPNRATA